MTANLLDGGLRPLKAALPALLRQDATCAAAAELIPGVSDPGGNGVGGSAARPTVPKGVGRLRAPTGVSRSAQPTGVCAAFLWGDAAAGRGLETSSGPATTSVPVSVFSLSAQAYSNTKSYCKFGLNRP